MKIGLRKLFSVKALVVAVIVAAVILQYVQLGRISSSVSFLESRDSSLITEIGQLKDTYISFGQDLNEVRAFLLMPTKDYMSFGEVEVPGSSDSSSDSTKNDDEVQLALFQYVDYLSVNKKLEESLSVKRGLLDSLAASADFQTYLSSMSLSLGTVSEDLYSASLSISDANGESVVLYYLSNEDGTLFLKTPLEKTEVDAENAEQFEKAAKDYLSLNKDKILDRLQGVREATAAVAASIASEPVQTAAGSKGYSIASDYTESDMKAHYAISSDSGDMLGEIVLDLQSLEISLVNLKDADGTVVASDLASSLPSFLETLDSSSLIERKVKEAREQVEKTIADDGFQMLLEGSGFSIASEPRFYDGRIFYDISDENGNLVSSIVVEESTAVINIVDSEGTNSQNLLFFDPEFKKKTLEIPDEIPEYGDEIADDDNSFNILIAGKHGNLVDTMIFAHVDEVRKEVRMISIPRDLHYNGRKINAFPYFYGMPELKKVLSDMTGYQLDKYVLIDMYAFIDVVDLIGGVDVTLEHAVIDPTYRTVDDGVVGTLHYEPGTYHLGGVEALRLARSRHTSSDFARAERQQLILKSLQNKAKNFGFGDADTLYEIAGTVLEKTDTDISIDEAISYYFRYQNYEIVSNDVMSSGNVLYVPPYITVEQCNSLIAAAEAAGQARPGCEGENHAYTLLPRDNNWNIIKWFFREKFEVTESA